MLIGLRKGVVRNACLSAACFVAVAPLLVSAAETGPPPEQPEASFLDRYGQLVDNLRKLDWDAEYPFIAQALDNVWKQQGWDDEANRFAHDLIREVAAIPPWEFNKRFELFSRRVTERYDLTPAQTAALQGALAREAGGMMFQHSGAMLDQAVEALRTRVEKRPFTPEQVARWTAGSEPVFRELREGTHRVVNQLSPLMKPEQKKILERDLAAFDKRWRVLEKMRERWTRGEWRPEDWGLQDDPVHQKGARGAEAGPIAPPKKPAADPTTRPGVVPSRWLAHDPSTWLAYVLDFEKRYKLDASQSNAVRSIHAELIERAAAYTKAHAEQLREVPASERATHEAYQPICVLFSELTDRLEAIPTTGQRDRTTR